MAIKVAPDFPATRMSRYARTGNEGPEPYAPVKSTQQFNFSLGDRVDGISCSYGIIAGLGRKGRAVDWLPNLKDQCRQSTFEYCSLPKAAYVTT
jgi:hypothetical protein